MIVGIATGVEHIKGFAMAKKAKPKDQPLLATKDGTVLKRPKDARAIVVQVKPDGWRALRQLALDLETSVQKLGVEAFNDLMAKHGRKQKIESAWD